MTKYFTNNFSIINLYKKPSIKSEVVTQMLYGDNFSILKKSRKWLKIKIKEVKNFRIYNGGPVSNENLYFIYKSNNPINGSLKIQDNFYWGGNINEIFKSIEEEIIIESNIRFFIGYSGWDFNQLKNEIKNNIIGGTKTLNITLGFQFKTPEF